MSAPRLSFAQRAVLRKILEAYRAQRDGGGVIRAVPLDRSAARRFIAEHHRHSKPPSVDVIRVGAEMDGKLIGVAMAARPLARQLCDGTTLEVSRVCSMEGCRNVSSFLYGAIARAAFALGYTRLVTYTLESEVGSSLRASGWIEDAEMRKHDPSGWKRQQGGSRSFSTDLFGARTTPDEAKRRWFKVRRATEAGA